MNKNGKGKQKNRNESKYDSNEKGSLKNESTRTGFHYPYEWFCTPD